MSRLLETQDLCKNFGGVPVARHINLRVDAGDLRCLIGPNGAGKSTLFRLILGTHTATSGRIFFDGQDVTRRRPHERIAAGLSIKFQAPAVFGSMSVGQNLAVAMQRRLRGAALDREVERMTDMLGLGGLRHAPAQALAHGQKQWLEIGMAIGLAPRLLLLDEPAAGMSPVEADKTAQLLRHLNDEGMTIVVIEHDMNFVRQVARQVTVLHLGSLFFEGTMDEVVANDDVVQIYLGAP